MYMNQQIVHVVTVFLATRSIDRFHKWSKFNRFWAQYQLIGLNLQVVGPNTDLCQLSSCDRLLNNAFKLTIWGGGTVWSHPGQALRRSRYLS